MEAGQLFKEVRFDNYLPYTVYLIPILFLTGPFFPDLFLSLSSIYFIYFTIKNKNYYLFDNLISKIFLLILTYFIIRSLFAKNIILSLESSLFYFRFFIFSLAIFYLLEKKLLDFNKLFLILIFSISIVTFSVFIEFFFFNEIEINGKIVDKQRYAGIFGEELISGSYISRLLPLLFYFFYKSKFKSKKKYIFFFFSFIYLCDIATFLSGERTSFFFITLQTIIFVICCSEFKRIRLGIFAVSLISIIIINIVSPSIKNRMIDYTVDQIGINTKIQDKNSRLKFFSLQDERHYGSAWKMFKDNKIFGQGPKMFRILCNEKKFFYKKDSCNIHPHHTYIQLLAETGLIGTIPIIITFLIICFLLLKHTVLKILINNRPYLNDLKILILTSLFISITPLAPGPNFFNNYISIIYYLPIGFLFFEFSFLHSLLIKNKTK